MQLVHEKTELLVQNFIGSIKEKPDSWRVISIEFQDCETLHSQLFQNLCLKNLHHFFDQTDCKIFWLKPTFLLIFFQGRAMPVEKCVEGFLKETEFKGFGRFFDILDLSIHWNELQMLLERAINNKAYEKESKDAKTIAAHTDNTFTIELTKEKIDHLRPIQKGRTKPLIMLVEDDPFTLQLVKLAFKQTYEVITAETVRQALVYYGRHLPDLVFLDIQLPDGSGIDLLKKMTNADNQAHIVMLSSHSQKEKILDCIEKGAKSFIAKPFTRQRLMDAAEKFVNARKIITGKDLHGT